MRDKKIARTIDIDKYENKHVFIILTTEKQVGSGKDRAVILHKQKGKPVEARGIEKSAYCTDFIYEVLSKTKSKDVMIKQMFFDEKDIRVVVNDGECSKQIFVDFENYRILKDAVYIRLREQEGVLIEGKISSEKTHDDEITK